MTHFCMSCFCCKCDLIYCKFCRNCDCEKSVKQEFYSALSNPLPNDWMNNPRSLVDNNLVLNMYVPNYDDFGDPMLEAEAKSEARQAASFQREEAEWVYGLDQEDDDTQWPETD